MAIAVGTRFSWQKVVEPNMTAHHFGNTGVEVLATPVLVGLFENTAVQALRDELAPGDATVGTLVNIRHLKATPVGDTITLTAEVVEVDGRRITFRVAAEDSQGPVGEGLHERVVVDLARFLLRAGSR